MSIYLCYSEHVCVCVEEGGGLVPRMFQPSHVLIHSGKAGDEAADACSESGWGCFHEYCRLHQKYREKIIYIDSLETHSVLRIKAAGFNI